LEIDSQGLAEHANEDGRLESLVAPGILTFFNTEELEEEPYE
jgi:preprotein translocase subunit Sec61beta